MNRDDAGVELLRIVNEGDTIHFTLRGTSPLMARFYVMRPVNRSRRHAQVFPITTLISGLLGRTMRGGLDLLLYPQHLEGLTEAINRELFGKDTGIILVSF